MNKLFGYITGLNRIWIISLLLILTALLYFPFLGSVHLFDWDEINFAETAREMLVTKDFRKTQIDYQNFYEKPPLFFWLQAFSMSLFGVGEYAARFPNAVCGVLTILVLFFTGSALRSKVFGFLWAVAYLGSILPTFYFRSGIIDPIYNLFSFLSFFLFYKAHVAFRKCVLYYLASGLFLGLALLTKGPAIPAIVVLTWLFIGWRKTPVWAYGLLLMPSFLLYLLWYEPQFSKEFIQYQIRLLTTADAGHKGPFYYHLVVLLLGCFPASIFALRQVFKTQSRFNVTQTPQFQAFSYAMKIFLLLVILVFSIVRTKILHYSSAAYFPITFFAALALEKQNKLSRSFTWLLASIGIILSILFIALPLAAMKKALWVPYLKDPFAQASILNTNVQWSVLDLWIGALFLGTTLYICVKLRKTNSQIQYALGLFAITAFVVLAIQLSFLPRIERYTQGAAISFYKEHQTDGSRVDVADFKSYAHLFYTRRLPAPDTLAVGKPAKAVTPRYLVTKVTSANQYRTNRKFKELKTEGGFVFFKEIH